MHVNRRAVFLSAGLVFAGIAATPALAANPSCPRGSSCTWRDTAFVTAGSASGYIGFTNDIPDLGKKLYPVTPGVAQTGSMSASSMQNNGNSDTVYYYKGLRCNNVYFTRPANAGTGSQDGDFTNGNPNFGDGSSAQDAIVSGAFQSYIARCQTGL